MVFAAFSFSALLLVFFQIFFLDFHVISFDIISLNCVSSRSSSFSHLLGAFIFLYHFDKTTCKSVEVHWFDVSDSVTNRDELKEALKKGDKV